MREKTRLGKIKVILLTDFVWSLFNGGMFKLSSWTLGEPIEFKARLGEIGIASVLIWFFIFSFIAAAVIGNDMIQAEAKKRTPVTPITSYDQKSSYGAGWLLVALVGVAGYIVGYFIFGII